jgi:hypothetical protein
MQFRCVNRANSRARELTRQRNFVKSRISSVVELKKPTNFFMDLCKSSFRPAIVLTQPIRSVPYFEILDRARFAGGTGGWEAASGAKIASVSRIWILQALPARAALQGTGSMFRLLLRTLGLFLLAGAFVTLIVDATRSMSSGTLYFVPIDESLMALLPVKFPLARDFVQAHVPPVLWDAVLVHLLHMPQWLALGITGVLVARLGRAPAPKFGWSSR